VARYNCIGDIILGAVDQLNKPMALLPVAMEKTPTSNAIKTSLSRPIFRIVVAGN